MPGCNICQKVKFNNDVEAKEHYVSLIHHIKLEQFSPGKPHKCSLCQFECRELPEYSKHIDSIIHKKRLSVLRRLHSNTITMDDTMKLDKVNMTSFKDVTGVTNESSKCEANGALQKTAAKLPAKFVNRCRVEKLKRRPLLNSPYFTRSAHRCRQQQTDFPYQVQFGSDGYRYSVCDGVDPYTLRTTQESSGEYGSLFPGFYEPGERHSSVSECYFSYVCDDGKSRLPVEAECIASIPIHSNNASTSVSNSNADDKKINKISKNETKISLDTPAPSSTEKTPACENIGKKLKKTEQKIIVKSCCLRSKSLKCIKLDSRRRYEKMALKGRALFSKNLHLMMSKNRHSKYRLIHSGTVNVSNSRPKEVEESSANTHSESGLQNIGNCMNNDGGCINSSVQNRTVLDDDRATLGDSRVVHSEDNRVAHGEYRVIQDENRVVQDENRVVRDEDRVIHNKDRVACDEDVPHLVKPKLEEESDLFSSSTNCSSVPCSSKTSEGRSISVQESSTTSTILNERVKVEEDNEGSVDESNDPVISCASSTNNSSTVTEVGLGSTYAGIRGVLEEGASVSAGVSAKVFPSGREMVKAETETSESPPEIDSLILQASSTSCPILESMKRLGQNNFSNEGTLTDKDKLQKMWTLVAEENFLMVSLNSTNEKLNRLHTEIMEELAKRKQIEDRIAEIREAKTKLLKN
uniref:C2H2-type domain-containing protein n=1 Tax=Syphacia muris TaxID=451379 RepID=A0A0N5AUV4_9BILA